jgi:polyphosphate glucokinase
MCEAIGIDFGATGIKAALVDVTSGLVLSERHRTDTPQPATPAAVRDVVVAMVDRFDVGLPVGVAVPGVVTDGVVRTAANTDAGWIGTSLRDLFDGTNAQDAVFLNDADAAGLAETAHGSAAGHDGLVVVVTLGTGIGTALIQGGQLVPNAELGHLELDGVDSEWVCSGAALERGGFAWDAWARDVSRYLHHLESLVWPDLIVIGGGVTSTPEPWFPALTARTELRLATHRKSAGIVGAAYAATQRPSLMTIH